MLSSGVILVPINRLDLLAVVQNDCQGYRSFSIAGTYILAEDSFSIVLALNYWVGGFGSGASLLLFANKQDLKGALTTAEVAQILELDKMANDRHWSIYGASAYTGYPLILASFFIQIDIRDIV